MTGARGDRLIVKGENYLYSPEKRKSVPLRENNTEGTNAHHTKKVAGGRVRIKRKVES